MTVPTILLGQANQANCHEQINGNTVYRAGYRSYLIHQKHQIIGHNNDTMWISHLAFPSLFLKPFFPNVPLVATAFSGAAPDFVFYLLALCGIREGRWELTHSAAGVGMWGKLQYPIVNEGNKFEGWN